MSDQRTPAPTRAPVLLGAAVACTLVLAAGGTIGAHRLLTAPAAPVAPAATLDAATLDAATAGVVPRPDSTRLAVQGPRRLLDPQPGGTLRPGGSAALPLPTLPAGTTAVLLQLTIRDTVRAGAVTVRSSTEQTVALRTTGAGGQSSATVVVGIGPDRRLRVRADGGGKLLVDLVGVFEPAVTATSGRVVATPTTRLLRLTPATDGNDATIDLSAVRGVPALRTAGGVSAVLIQVSGDVGRRGGYVALGPTADRLDQSVYWSATTGEDRVRPGFLVVPVRSGRLAVRYHAGTQVRLDLVGYVTGPAAPSSTAGLAVAVPAAAPTPATMTADGRVDVTVVPAGGTAGLTPDRVSAALLTVTATGATAGAVSVDAPGAAGAGVPDVSAGPTGRSALALTGVVAGMVTVVSGARATVLLTPRVLVLTG